MTKLIKIPFDASLIGQDGIVVKYGNGETPDFVKVYLHTVVTIDDLGIPYTMNRKTGVCIDEQRTANADLIMYREQKVMSVDLWKVEQLHILNTETKAGDYKDGLFYGYNLAVNQLAAAIKNGTVEI